jgi:hypothetical protein
MTSILPSLSKGFRELVPTFSQGKGEEQTPLNPPLLRGEINQAPLLDKEEIDQAPLLDRGEMDQVPLLDKEGVGEVFLQQLISISFKVLFGFAFVVFSL